MRCLTIDYPTGMYRHRLQLMENIPWQLAHREVAQIPDSDGKGTGSSLA